MRNVKKLLNKILPGIGKALLTQLKPSTMPVRLFTICLSVFLTSGVLCAQAAEKTQGQTQGQTQGHTQQTKQMDQKTELQKFAVAQPHMGVQFEIVCFAKDEKMATTATDAAFARIAELNKALSDYDPQSEISKLAASAPHDTPQPISEDLAAVLQIADEVYQQSGGAFDPTIGPLSKLWRRARRLHAFPEDEKLKAAREAVGWKLVEFSAKDKTVRFLKPGMSLDLGGIAKGFAADEALKVLGEHGVASALINASGDLAASDAPPGEAGWKVGVAPLEADAPPSITLLLANSGVATSGDAFQFVEIEGKRYSHIFDPRTGMPLTRRSSVTVTAANGCLADAWASAFSVLSPKQAERQVLKTGGIEYFVVESEDDSIQTRRSQGFPAKSSAPSSSKGQKDQSESKPEAKSAE